VFNGAIYNFVELGRELGWSSDRLQGCSDTDVLLHTLIERGEAALLALDGMWAFALWDACERTLLLSRDRFGEKPLFYAPIEGGWAFASEVQAFRAHPDHAPRLNERATEAMLAGQPIPHGETLLEGVHELPAGSIAHIRQSGIKLTQWWDTLEHLPALPSRYEERVEAFHSLINTSVARRLRADVPIGCSLSGGFDSTAIAGLMGERTAVDDRTSRSASAFVVASPWSLVDETPAAQRAADSAHLRLEIVHSPAEVGVDAIEHAVDALDGVYGAPTLVAHLLYARMRQLGCYCTLEGHGLDELIGGYTQFDRAMLASAPSLFASPIANAARIRAVHGFHLAYPARAGASVWMATARSMLLLHPSLAPLRRLVQRTPASQPSLDLRRAAEAGLGPFGAAMHEQFSRTLLPRLLANVDRTAMCHGIEVRSPFLAWDVVTFATALPDDDRLDGVSKRIARDAMCGHMDEAIRTSHVKVGYYTPLREWLAGPLRNWTQTCLEQPPESMIEHNILNEARYRWTRFDRDRTMPNAYAVWTALSLARYSRNVRGWANTWRREP